MKDRKDLAISDMQLTWSCLLVMVRVDPIAVPTRFEHRMSSAVLEDAATSQLHMNQR